MSWLNAGEHAKRWGTEHPSIVPHQDFKTKDGHLVLGAYEQPPVSNPLTFDDAIGVTD